MDIAIVTGAETPLGLRIVQSLIQQGYRVHGIGNNFSRVTYADPQFKAYALDLTELEAVTSTLDEILKLEQRLDCLIHAIDVTPGNAFDKLPAGNLEAILKIGLLGPVMMTRLALPNLLRFRGQLINLITGNKHGHPASAVNALVEGGLREMNKALFDQGRDAGLRITNCVLRQNSGLSEASVSDDVLAQSHISLDDVGRTIEQLIDPKALNVPQELVLYPQLSAAAEEALPLSPLPLDPYTEVVLPPKEYCPPKEPKIPTEKQQQIERTIPYTDDEMEDKIAAAIEDFEAHPERYEIPDPAKPRQEQQGRRQQGGQHPGNQQKEGSAKNKRRRRGGRNRNKKSQAGDGPKQENTPVPQQQGEAESQPEPKPKNSKSKRSVKDKPAADPKPVESPTPKKKAATKAPKTATKKVAKVSQERPQQKPAKALKESAPRKKTAAKKAAKKSAKKKTAARKADKKTAKKSEN